ncbi:bromodomain protein [Aphelenchoides avenae]|nr:bromodomain protein [Aphelenchus avenae]
MKQSNLNFGIFFQRLKLRSEPARALSVCAQRVADIWIDGYGVIVLPVITKLYDDDAKGREAALISLKTIGLSNLVNAARGNFPPLDNVTPKDWEELGVMELIKAYKLYKRIEAKCCYLWDIPSQIEDIELWYGVCPTPYRSEVTLDEPSTSTSHIPSATGRPEGSGNLPASLPPANAKEWHASITQELRHHMVAKLVKAVFPSPALATLPDAKAKHLVSYARKAEKEMFEVADDKEEYYHLLALKIYKIEKEVQARKDKRLTESQ